MLDDLLGRTELKERIAALEEEQRHLERELDAERERRAEAVTARQEAQRRANRLEDRIAELEGRVSADREAEADASFRRTERLRGDRCGAVLDRLASVAAPPEGALTAMVDDDLHGDVRDALGDRAVLVDRAAPCLVVADDAGLVAATLSPPDPPAPFSTWDDGFDLERDWFLPRGRFGLALVRGDLFAYGEYDGGERVDFEGFESDVKSDHSKGGFSQARFERVRDGQIADHLDRCREAIDSRAPDRLYVVGDRRLADEFVDRAEVTAAVDATGSPEAALDDAFRSFWTTRLHAL